MKKLILIIMFTMLAACSDENFDGTYVGAVEPSPIIMSAIYTLKVTGDKATMANNYNSVIEVIEASVSGDTLAIPHPHTKKMIYLTFTDDRKALICKECSPKIWKKVEDKKQEKEQKKEKEQEENSWFQSLINFFFSK